jgi:hypothetical protein
MPKHIVPKIDLARGEEEERGKERESYHTWRFYHMVMPQASNKLLLKINNLNIKTAEDRYNHAKAHRP